MTGGPVRAIDLSADVGELDGDEGRRIDAALLAVVSTAHIAAGGHAGDDATIAASIRACVATSTRVGCHPSYVDPDGFGRRRVTLPAHVIVEQVVEQVGRVDELARAAGTRVRSVKPHGQLYHDMADDDELCALVLAALPADVLVVVPATRQPLDGASHRLVAEGFADRGYGADGRLVPRTETGALLADPHVAAAQALRLATEGIVVGTRRHVVDSLCVHSDAPGATDSAARVREVLEGAGIVVAPPTRP